MLFLARVGVEVEVQVFNIRMCLSNGSFWTSLTMRVSIYVQWKPLPVFRLPVLIGPAREQKRSERIVNYKNKNYLILRLGEII
jgi:hypothetical protein